MENQIPKSYTDMVGTTESFSGQLFSKKAIKEESFDILGVRWSFACIASVSKKSGEIRVKHPAVEFLLKNKSMKRSRWTTPFPVREITL